MLASRGRDREVALISSEWVLGEAADPISTRRRAEVSHTFDHTRAEQVPQAQWIRGVSAEVGRDRRGPHVPRAD